jgi:hypothetical protein
MRVLSVWLLVAAGSVAVVQADPTTLRLAPRNSEVPFAYLVGSKRSWPVVLGDQRAAGQLRLQYQRDGKVAQSGSRLRVGGVTVVVSAQRELQVLADAGATERLSLELILDDQGQTTTQTIQLQPAPPPRPISYISDLVDDLIRIFWDGGARRWRPFTRDAFDQYFRRLQCQGVSRLIVWPSPFPVLADPANYPQADWQRYVDCSRAILENKALNRSLRNASGLPSWRWLGLLMKLRLNPSIMRQYAASAQRHGIRLSVSFRPFEAALTKYYVVPTFDHSGDWLWNFLPSASPATQFHPDRVGFAHYRTLLQRMGQPAAARLETLELSGVPQARELAARFAAGHRDLQLRASAVAPIDEQSLVLMRDGGGEMRLVPYETLRPSVESRLPVLRGWSLEATGDTSVRLTGLRRPAGLRFLWLEAQGDFGATIRLPADGQASLRSAADNRLGRVNAWWSLTGDDEESRRTRIVGIPTDGQYRTEFQAIEASHAVLLKRKAAQVALADKRLILDLGPDWAVETVDFEQPLARREALAEIATQLALPAYDEIFINTRSHTQLAASVGDGVLGIKPILDYRRAGKNYQHLGIDRGAAPRGLAQHAPWLRSLERAGSVEPLTTWQVGAWKGACPTDASRFAWRFHRSRAIARGVRRLLVDLEQRFPNTRIRAVLPPRSAVENEVTAALVSLKKPDKGVYGADFYRHIWGSLNHIPAIGEGMAEVDLSDLRTEPVFLGIRYLPPPGPLKLFVDASVVDLKGNRGSRFNGPRSFCYEAQETLRRKDKQATAMRREQIIRGLLARSEDIGEVILYEAADWTYNLSLDDPHRYLAPASPSD